MPPSSKRSRFWRCWADLLLAHLEEQDYRHRVPVLGCDIMRGEESEMHARQ